jgi:hypothetical protein
VFGTQSSLGFIMVMPHNRKNNWDFPLFLEVITHNQVFKVCPKFLSWATCIGPAN